MGLAMTNAELAQLLNRELGLTGRDAVSANVIRQWVDWDVLPKAIAKGRMIGQRPAWSRSESDRKRALRLAELRKLGVKRETALIVQAYIEWGHPDFERVRNALLHEWAKWRTQLTRRQTTFSDNIEYRKLSRVKKRAIANQIGSLDDRFQDAQFAQSPEFYAMMSELARTGETRAERVTGLIQNALETTLPGIGQLLPSDCATALANSLSGIAGDPHEIGNSAHSEIEAATEREFLNARRITRRLMPNARRTERLMRRATIPTPALLEMQHSLAPQISVGPWAAALLVQSILHLRRGGEGPGIKVNLGYSGDLSALFPPNFDMPKA